MPCTIGQSRLASRIRKHICASWAELVRLRPGVLPTAGTLLVNRTSDLNGNFTDTTIYRQISEWINKIGLSSPFAKVRVGPEL